MSSGQPRKPLFTPCRYTVEKTYADDALFTVQFDVLIFYGTLGVPLCVSLEVAEVTHVAFGVRRSAVLLGERIDWSRPGSCCQQCFRTASMNSIW